jgi:hypothetical protein
MGLHQIRFWSLERAFRALSHPPGTRSIRSFSDLGLLFGNGNHTDYAVMDIREIVSPTVDLAAFYARCAVPGPDGASTPVSFRPWPEVEPWMLPHPLAGECLDFRNASQVYLVDVVCQEAAGYDPRSH